MATERKSHKMVITLENVLPSDAIALKKMFEYMEYLGNIGSSKMCSFYADGDGSFRPKVSFDYPIELPEVPEVDGILEKGEFIDSHPGDFVIDSDTIAWKIYHDPEPENYVRPKNPGEDTLCSKISEK